MTRTKALIMAAMGAAILFAIVSCGEDPAEAKAKAMRNQMSKGFVSLKVTGTSMEPVYVAGDVGFVAPLPFKNVQIGDDIVFVPYRGLKNQGLSVVHRVLAVESGRIVTAGINNPVGDPSYVTEANYVGLFVKMP